MPRFIIAYLGGQDARPEAAAAGKAEWQAWVEGLGEAAVNPGTPLKDSRFVSADGVAEPDGAPPLIGYSIVEAADMAAALEMAKACPYLAIGRLQVAELMQM